MSRDLAHLKEGLLDVSCESDSFKTKSQEYFKNRLIKFGSCV